MATWLKVLRAWSAGKREAEAPVARSGNHSWCAELHRLRAVFLAAMDADEANIQASLCAAIRIAKEQKSVSLEKRAESNLRGVPSPKKRTSQEEVDFEHLFGNMPAAP